MDREQRVDGPAEVRGRMRLLSTGGGRAAASRSSLMDAFGTGARGTVPLPVTAATGGFTRGGGLAAKLKELGLGVTTKTIEEVVVDGEWFTTV